MNMLEQHGIVKTGHFRLASGRHSAKYVNKDAIWPKGPCVYRQVVYGLAELAGVGKPIVSRRYDLVTGPAIAGAVLAATVAWLVDKPFVYPEKIVSTYHDQMEFRRGFPAAIKDKRVLIIEDVITTGASVIKVANAIWACDGAVTGVVCMWNRSSTWPAGMPSVEVRSLVHEAIESWEAKECPLCAEGVPLTDPKGGDDK